MMMVPEIVEKFAELESRIAREDERGVVDYFVSQIKSRLGKEWLVNLSRIVVIEPQAAALQALNRKISVEHGRGEVRDTNFFGQPVKLAYIITSQRPQALAPA